MRINKNYILRQLGDNTYVIETAVKDINYNKIVTFNHTAAFLWNEFNDKEFTLEEIVNCIIRKYNISQEKALLDASVLIEKWKDAGLIIQ